MAGLPVRADTCPVCGAVHLELDEFWACPKHGHKLQFTGTAGNREKHTCPVQRCGYQRTAPPRPRSTSQGDPMTAIATRPSVAVDTMWDRQTHIAAILPAHIDAKSFIGTAAAALYGSADLMKAAETSPESLIAALMECASLGHRPGTEEYYLTPRKDHGRPKVLGIEGYRGIVERMYRSGAVAKVIVREVCARDYFRYTEGEDDKPVHRFNASGEQTGAGFFGAQGNVNRGPMVGVYAYAQLTTGAYSRVVLLSRDDVHAARDSGGYKPDDTYTPWNRMDGGKDHPELKGRSMWWKTAAKRLEPWVPTSAEYRREQLRAAAAASPAPSGPAAGYEPAPGPVAPTEDIHDAEIVDSPEPEERAEPRATTGQLNIIRSRFRALGYDDPGDPAQIEEQLAFTARLAGLDPDGLTSHGAGELTQDQAGIVIGHLKGCKTRDDLVHLIYDGEAPSE